MVEALWKPNLTGEVKRVPCDGEVSAVPPEHAGRYLLSTSGYARGNRAG